MLFDKRMPVEIRNFRFRSIYNESFIRKNFCNLFNFVFLLRYFLTLPIFFSHCYLFFKLSLFYKQFVFIFKNIVNTTVFQLMKILKLCIY